MSVQFSNLPPAAVTIRPEAPPVLTSGLDLILPCWNPSGNWVQTLVQQYTALTAVMGEVPVQLILVNDGSVQNFTEQHCNMLEAAIPDIIIVSYSQNRGKGYAVREGVKRSVYPYQIYTDLDFPFGIEAVKTTYNALLEDTDIVAGERGAAYLAKLPRKRRIITRCNRLLNKLILQLKVDDAQAGLKGFNRQGREILLKTTIDGFLYDSEFIYRAGRQERIRITAVPVFCRPDIRFSSFRIKLLLQELRNYIRILSANA